MSNQLGKYIGSARVYCRNSPHLLYFYEDAIISFCGWEACTDGEVLQDPNPYAVISYYQFINLYINEEYLA